jgi:rhamnulose-1-phosphate aldolase/alcohol dehydrogenase
MPAFQHVSDRWDEARSAAIAGDEVALLLYRSNLLGADLAVTNFAGGNTSCKASAVDPLTGAPVEVLWVKGSGGDLATMRRDGLASLYLDKLRGLRRLYHGADHEDAMVAAMGHCIFNLNPRAPSIDTPLHGFLPARHVDHLHPDSVIAIAASRDGPSLTHAIFGDRIGWLDWRRPGFALALQLAEMVARQPDLEGVLLGGHGLMSWADTSVACYRRSLSHIEACADFIAARRSGRISVFGTSARAPLSETERRRIAAAALPVLRGLAARREGKIAHFRDTPEIMEFINSTELTRLAERGTSCPDHFLRTKVKPLVLVCNTGVAGDPDRLRQALEPQFDAYARDYTAYYEAHRRPGTPALRDPNPAIVLWPGVGMVALGKDKATARVAAEYYVNAINVMRGAETVSSYVGLAPAEAFGIEYWALEDAKLNRLPPDRPLARRVALITGAAGGIGRAIALRFAGEGAAVVLTDRDETRLRATLDELAAAYGADNLLGLLMDVTDEASVERAFDAAVLGFGGLDILVNNAGLSRAGDIADFAMVDYDMLSDVMARGAFLCARAFARRVRAQRRGGDVIYVASKNGVFAGPANVAYGSIKAAQAHQARLLAAELGKDGVRVNTINPDAVIQGSGIWAGGWAEGRAKAYGIGVGELGAYYAKRTLLNVEILPEDVAAAAFCLVGGELSKTTGAIIPVDGGIPAAFPR